MDDTHDPATDAALLRLKRAALAGRGEHGRAFDRGVLAVIEQVERWGEFLPDPVRVVYAVHKVLDRDLPDVLRPEDVEAARRLVAERGWTMEEGAAYARGVVTAEKDLAHFRAGAAE